MPETKRKKWIYTFDRIDCVLFVVNLGEYDIPLFDNPDKSRLTELFVSFVKLATDATKPPIIDATKLLIFNKSDVFFDKFINRKISLNKSGSFPDAPTSVSLFFAMIPLIVELEYNRTTQSDFDTAIHYFFEKFTEDVPEERMDYIYNHVVSASDDSSMVS